MVKRTFLFMAVLMCTSMLSAKTVQVTVSPAEAIVLKQKGEVLQPVTQGVYSITCSIVDLAFTVQADGYDSESFVINLKSPKTMEIKLKPNRKHVVVTSDPKDAVIYVDGREAGRGQVEFDIHKGESKTIELVADEYDTSLKRINFNDQSSINMTYNIPMVLNTRTINVLVDAPSAEFFADGIMVTKGKNSATFQIHKDKPTQLIVRAEGFLEYTKMVYFDQEGNSINLTSELSIDKAYSASEPGALIANKRTEITIKKGMSRDDAIQRMKYYISELFESLEINDNVAGWYRTVWNVEQYPDKIIRSRYEIKEIPDNGDGKLKFKLLLQSQVSYTGTKDEDFRDWDRVLKKYAKLHTDIRSLVTEE